MIILPIRKIIERWGIKGGGERMGEAGKAREYEIFDRYLLE